MCVGEVSLAEARARTVWQTRLLSGRFDCITPTMGQSAWCGYLVMTVAMILYKIAWTVGSGWRIRETNCGKAVRYCQSQLLNTAKRTVAS